MSIDQLEGAAKALGELTEDVVFLGAATLPLWISDPVAPPLRATADVDVMVEATTLIAYNRFEQQHSSEAEGGAADVEHPAGKSGTGSQPDPGEDSSAATPVEEPEAND